jgi:hypothetical protein
MNYSVAFELLKIHLGHIPVKSINDVIYDCFRDAELGLVGLRYQRQHDRNV